MSEATNTPATEQVVKIRRSPEFRRVYSNTFRYRLSASDFTIFFQYLTDNPETSSAEVIEEVELTMSHNQAKAFFLYISKLITAFEQEFGTIKSTGGPPDDHITGMISRIKRIGFR